MTTIQNQGMNLTALQNAVYTETNRPDLVNETLQKVLEATLSLHTVEDWYKDIVEAPVTFTVPTWQQVLDLSAVPFYRNVAYIRKLPYPPWNSSNLSTGGYGTWNTPDSASLWPGTEWARKGDKRGLLTAISPDDFLDMYGYEKIDVYYQAGKQINIKSSTQIQQVILGWYAYPNIDSSNNGANFSSWIAIEQPYAIVYRAAASIFSMIGQDKTYNFYMRPPAFSNPNDEGGLYYQQLAALKRNNIIVTGF